MQREESGEGRAGDDGSAQHQFHNRRTENRNAAGDRSSNSQSPISVLIEAQHLSGERHAESHQQQKDSEDPGQFARKFVGAEQKYLRHMNEDDGHHEVGAPSVHRADEPAERHLMIQGLQAAPCFASRGNINKRQQNSGDDLQEENGERGATEDVEPARRISRDRMFGDLANRRCELQAVVEPFADFA